MVTGYRGQFLGQASGGSCSTTEEIQFLPLMQ